uniref:Uncharacterized protein n=1 Tax=Metamycoplasma arthritidis TaxID=2111 RepID=Q6E6P7_METAT|nr:hypothetical protein [Mycoplasma arthritidis] [Metamycoplasma arthritidis]
MYGFNYLQLYYSSSSSLIISSIEIKGVQTLENKLWQIACFDVNDFLFHWKFLFLLWQKTKRRQIFFHRLFMYFILFELTLNLTFSWNRTHMFVVVSYSFYVHYN